MVAASEAGPDQLSAKMPDIMLTINRCLGGAYMFDEDLRSQMLNSFSKAVCGVLEIALNRQPKTLTTACSARKRRARLGFNHRGRKGRRQQHQQHPHRDDSGTTTSVCPYIEYVKFWVRFQQWLYHLWLLLVMGHTDYCGCSLPELAASGIWRPLHAI